ncbi:hypothetical protein ACMFMG_008771 [Clarireedia jacksonii]
MSTQRRVPRHGLDHSPILRKAAATGHRTSNALDVSIHRFRITEVSRFLAFTTRPCMYLTYLASFLFHAQHGPLELGNEDAMHPSHADRLIRLFIPWQGCTGWCQVRQTALLPVTRPSDGRNMEGLEETWKAWKLLFSFHGVIQSTTSGATISIDIDRHTSIASIPLSFPALICPPVQRPVFQTNPW